MRQAIPIFTFVVDKVYQDHLYYTKFKNTGDFIRNADFLISKRREQQYIFLDLLILCGEEKTTTPFLHWIVLKVSMI